MSTHKTQNANRHTGVVERGDRKDRERRGERECEEKRRENEEMKRRKGGNGKGRGKIDEKRHEKRALTQMTHSHKVKLCTTTSIFAKLMVGFRRQRERRRKGELTEISGFVLVDLHRDTKAKKRREQGFSRRTCD